MEVAPGQAASRELTVTAEMVRAYAEITGDFNPLHFDEAFASRTRFSGLTAQGGIATGLVHALVAMELPGPGSVFDWAFPKPVYIGDTLRAEARVLTVFPRRSMARLDVAVTNQHGEVVLRGEATVLQLSSGDSTDAESS